MEVIKKTRGVTLNDKNGSLDIFRTYDYHLKETCNNINEVCFYMSVEEGNELTMVIDREDVMYNSFRKMVQKVAIQNQMNLNYGTIIWKNDDYRKTNALEISYDEDCIKLAIIGNENNKNKGAVSFHKNRTEITTEPFEYTSTLLNELHTGYNVEMISGKKLVYCK